MRTYTGATIIDAQLRETGKRKSRPPHRINDFRREWYSPRLYDTDHSTMKTPALALLSSALALAIKASPVTPPETAKVELVTSSSDSTAVLIRLLSAIYSIAESSQSAADASKSSRTTSSEKVEMTT